MISKMKRKRMVSIFYEPMNPEKRKSLEEQGWKFGNAEDFLKIKDVKLSTSTKDKK